jgi:XisI protein
MVLMITYGRLRQREVESQLVFDVERNHYQIMHVGWRNKHRIYGCVVHLDIKDGKIWIQHNGIYKLELQ